MRRFGGALLADGVGTGKTWIALAVATALEPGRPVHLLVPAALITQWKEAARRTAVRVLLHSHETLSRGRPPAPDRGPVIVDESHRFRTPSTRRYETAAPWLTGRRGLLLSATPSVNWLEDVAHQLLLLVRDDALAWSGVPSLLSGLREGAPAGLGHLVVTGEDRSGLLPARSSREVQPVEPPGSPLLAIHAGISALRLSLDPVVASLIRVVLLSALASSPAAVAEALRRYRGLLLHARDAAAAGSVVSRHAIRRMVGAEAEQLVFWPLVAEAAPVPELAIDDLARVAALEENARRWCLDADAKVVALRAAVADGKPTLVFATLTATVRHLRAHLGSPRIAWCTGSAAGLDRVRLPRDVVLDWFRNPALSTDGVAARPKVLVATDVAAEGLDLPLVTRVVHYDLPWTAVRLEQRSGRAFRLGSTQREVEVIRFRPPAALESALHKEAILELKSGLARVLGLGSEADAPWRLRARIAAAWEGIPPIEGSARVSGEIDGVVAGFRIAMGDGTCREIVVARSRPGWSDDGATIAALLERARSAASMSAPDPRRLRSALRGFPGVVRSALRVAQGTLVPGADRSPAVRRLMRELMLLARGAARRRDTESIRLLEQGTVFLGRGHTAGEALLIDRWARLPADDLLDAIGRVPRSSRPAPVLRVELIGVLVIERGERPG